MKLLLTGKWEVIHVLFPYGMCAIELLYIAYKIRDFNSAMLQLAPEGQTPSNYAAWARKGSWR